jgi:hypothetical protein
MGDMTGELGFHFPQGHRFSPLLNVQIRSGAHSALYPNATVVSLSLSLSVLKAVDATSSALTPVRC